MTSYEAAQVYERAHRRWFYTAFRKRLHDGERQMWKDRFCARAVLLIARWRGLAAEQERIAKAVQEERTACAEIAASIHEGYTEIPRRDAAAWYACAEFVENEIRSRA